MSILGKVLKTVIDVATVPISIAADVVTLGGAITERDKPYTVDHVKTVGEDLINICEDIEKL